MYFEGVGGCWSSIQQRMNSSPLTSGGGTSRDHPRQGWGDFWRRDWKWDVWIRKILQKFSAWPGDIIPNRYFVKGNSPEFFMFSFEMVFEFTVWHIEFNSKLYDVVSWNQSIYVFQCISYIYTVYCIYVDWTYISENEIQASTLPSCLLFLSCQILWWVCRIPLGSMTKQRLPIRSGSAGNLELSWYYWNLLLSSLASLISHWCPRYGCACVLLFPLCHLADCHRFVARCCKAWLSHSSDRGHSLSQLISSLTCRTVSCWNTMFFSHVTSFHMAGQEVNSPNMSLTQFGERLWFTADPSISLSWFYVVTSEVCVGSPQSFGATALPPGEQTFRWSETLQVVSQVRLFDSRLADPFQSVVEVGDWSTLSGGL